MAWEWSHTEEAYENAYNNVCTLPFEELCCIMAEWDAWNGKGPSSGNLDPDIFDLCQAEYLDGRLDSDTLEDAIWSNAQDLRTCDNGGHRAWICPFGCHTVSFDAKSVSA